MTIMTPFAAGVQIRGQASDIIVDCDEVLLNWSDGFAGYCADRLGRSLHPDGPAGWDMRSWLGLDDPEEVNKLVAAFNSGDQGRFARLTPYQDAVRALQALAEAGRNIHVVTSCSSDPVIAGMRRDNLQQAFGSIFGHIECLDIGAPKGPVLESFAPAVWVEDNHANAIAGAAAGHDAFLIRRNHNRGIEAGCERRDIRWVHGWDEIVEALSLG
jgi:phosphoglycolate phosphatase-like HAD superfamily hydrolase